MSRSIHAMIRDFEFFMKSGPPTHRCSCGIEFWPHEDGGCNHCGQSGRSYPIDRIPPKRKDGQLVIGYMEFNRKTGEFNSYDDR